MLPLQSQILLGMESALEHSISALQLAEE